MSAPDRLLPRLGECAILHPITVMWKGIVMRRIFLLVLLALATGASFAFWGCGDDDGPVDSQPTAWFTEFVDTAELTGYFTSVAVDATGLPHIVYFDGTRDDLNYAYFDGTEWHIALIDPDVFGKASTTFTTLVIDSQGRLHVAYTDAENGDLKYARSDDGAVWDIQPVDTVGAVGVYPAMALDAVNQPYISYGKTVDTVSGLYVAFLEGDSLWTRLQLDTTGEVSFSSIAVEPDGEMHIAYQMGLYGFASLRYTTGNNFLWLRDTLAGPGSLGQYCSIDLGAGNVPSIAYSSGTGSWKLNLATRSGSDWTVETVDESATGTTGLFCTLLFDSANRPRIGYHEEVPGAGAEVRCLVKYAVKNSGAWGIEIADSLGVVGAYLDLAIDSEGRPHLSYQDRENSDLKYAVKR